MRPSKRAFTIVALAASLLMLNGFAVAAKKGKEPSPTKTPKAAQEARAEHYAYLGVGVEELHPAVLSHLHNHLANGEGVLVGQVAAGSPADKAGLKVNDVLMTYGDQKLFSPEQLAKLVRADKPGREVTLGILRQGKSEQVTVTLGQHEAERGGETSEWRPERHSTWRFPMPFVERPARGENERFWESFDSLSLRNLGNNRFKAEIRYKDENGKMSRHEFQGTRDEIAKAIDAEKNLPANERRQLLRSLDMESSAAFPSLSGWEIQ
jgi:hypothetical protein